MDDYWKAHVIGGKNEQSLFFILDYKKIIYIFFLVT